MPSESSTVLGLAYRQEPKANRKDPFPPGVRIRLAGNGASEAGHTSSPSRRTSYGVVLPGSRSSTTTSA
jgi:hypothetical protein